MIADHEYIRQLFIEKLTGTLNPADETVLQQLLSKNEENRAFYATLVAESKRLNAEQFIANIDEQAALHTLKQQIKPKKIPLWRYVAAAVVLIAVGVGIWLNVSQHQNTASPLASKKKNPLNDKAIQLQLDNGEVLTLNKQGKNELINLADVKIQTSEDGIAAINGGEANRQTTLYVPAKQDYHITLSDGTKIWLNSISKLQFPLRFNGPQREVYIEGEAYLEVAKDASKPFIVHTKTTDIKVLGTKFNVNTYTENIAKTALVEGAVLLTANNKSVRLTPGQQGVYHTNEGFTVAPFDAGQTISWINGIYYFQNSSLKEIATVINRWFAVEVVFENPQLANLRLSGLLEKQQLTAFLKDLETSSDVESKLVDNKLYLK